MHKQAKAIDLNLYALEVFVNNRITIIKLGKEQAITFPCGYEGFSCHIYAIYFLDIKIYIILQVIVDCLKTILSVKLTTVNEDNVVK